MSLPAHLVTGHPELDRQHQELFEKANEFFAKTQGAVISKADLRAFLGYLHDYTVSHFRFEEHLMLEMRYPAYWGHEAEHALFWREVLGLMDRCDGDGFDQQCGARVRLVVLRWLSEHIEKEDLALVQWIRAKTDGML